MERRQEAHDKTKPGGWWCPSRMLSPQLISTSFHTVLASWMQREPEVLEENQV